MTKHRIILLVLCFAAIGCGRTRYYEAQTVADAGNGAAWLAGTEGLAAYWDGGQLHRHDYPLRSDAPDWAYERRSAGPTASVVMAGTRPYVFTAAGDVYRWNSPGWERLAVDFRTYAFEPQVNAVLRRPDGGLLIQIHADVLLWTTFEDLEDGRFEAARAPTYFTSLSYDSKGTLYGLGWGPGGNERVVARRVDRRWEIVANLSSEREYLHERGMTVLDSGHVVLVYSQAALFIDPTTGQWDKRTPVELAYLGGADVGAAIGSGDDPTVYFGGVAQEAGGGLLLFVSSPAAGFVRLSGEGVSFFPCGIQGRSAVGALARSEDLLLMDGGGQMWSLREQGCTAVAPPSIASTAN